MLFLDPLENPDGVATDQNLRNARGRLGVVTDLNRGSRGIQIIQCAALASDYPTRTFSQDL
jgi:hypothetical protein